MSDQVGDLLAQADLGDLGDGSLITEMGDLVPGPNERVIDATDCVVTPGFVNTHHHLFQSLMKSIPATIDGGLDNWVMEGPHRFWPAFDEEARRHLTPVPVTGRLDAQGRGQISSGSSAPHRSSSCWSVSSRAIPTCAAAGWWAAAFCQPRAIRFRMGAKPACIKGTKSRP